MPNFNPAVTEYIQKAIDEHIVILERLRRLIHDTIPNTSEAIKWGFPVFTSTKDFVYFRHGKRHVTLGFYNVDKISSRSLALEGSGTILRHLKIKKDADISVNEIEKVLKEVAI